MQKPLYLKAIVSAAVIVLSFVLTGVVISRVTRIEPGQIGIRIDYAGENSIGDADVEPLGAGYHVAWLGQKIVEYPGAQQTLSLVRKVDGDKIESDNSIQCQDSRGVQINIDATTLWRINPERAGNLFNLRPNASADTIRDQIVRRDTANAVTVACSHFEYHEILGEQRADFAADAAGILKPSLERSFLILDQVIIGEIHLQDAQATSIAQVDAARQAARQAAFLQEQRENEAAAAIAEAEGRKQVQILQAEGQAESIRIIQEQLSSSPSYLHYLAIQQWDGVMPLYMPGDEGLFSFLLPGQPRG